MDYLSADNRDFLLYLNERIKLNYIAKNLNKVYILRNLFLIIKTYINGDVIYVRS